MFMELGAKLDNLLYDIKLWNTQRVWYKPISYFTIKNWIKKKRFKDSGAFIKFLNTVKSNNQLWGWQCKRLIKTYEELFEEEVDKYYAKEYMEEIKKN